MPRPRKQTADYFPHFARKNSRTLSILEHRWGNDGYAFWFKLLEILCDSDGHCYDCSANSNRVYIEAFTNTDNATATEILDTLADLGKIDRELWRLRSLIWCQSLVDNFAQLYSKRTESLPLKPRLDASGEPETEPKPKAPPPPPKEQEAEKEQPAKGGRPKGKSKKPELRKVSYAEFVSMTEDEYAKLVKAHGQENTQRMIDKLNNQKGAKGITYKSDYRAILSWVVEWLNEQNAKRGADTAYGRSNPNWQDFGTTFRASGGFRSGDGDEHP